MRTIHGLLVGLIILTAACAGGATSASPAAAVPASSAPAPAESRTAPATTAPSAASSAPVTGAGDLPPECVESIKAYLVAVEPIVKDVPWTTMIATPPEVEARLGEAGATVDQDACPELSAVEAHDAWIAIALDAAPGTLDYIDFIYRP
jgi:hypothetical protein